MQQRRRFLVAAAAGIVAAGIFGLILVEARPQLVGGTPPATVTATVPVVVASGDIAQGTKIDKTNVVLAPYPATAVPTSALTDPNQAYGQYSAISLPSGTMILQTFLLSAPPSAANSVTHAPLPIAAGNEALSIPVDDTKGVGGYIQPGDRLDILVSTSDGTVHYGFQGVRVLRVGSASANGTGDPTLLVIELPPDKAAALSYLYSRGGDSVVRILLRPQSVGSGKLSNGIPVGPNNWTQYLDG